MVPILFELPGGIPIYSYGIMLGLSCVIGAHIAVYLSARSGIPEKKAWYFALSVALTGIVGGRLHDVIVNASSFEQFLEEITKLQHAGRTAYGAFLSGSIAAIAFSRLYGVGFWRFADAAAPNMALGLGLTRIGCFLWGCDYGVRTERWGLRFPRGSPAWQDQNAAGLVPFGAPKSLPVFPMQLVESAVGFAIGGALLAYWFRRPRREGSVLLAFFGLYGVARAILEIWRDDVGRGELLGMSTSMAIGLFTAAAAGLAALPPLARLRPECGPVLPPPKPADEEEKAA